MQYRISDMSRPDDVLFTSVVLDTAIEHAKKASGLFKGVFLVTLIETPSKGSRAVKEVRAFAEKGFVRWARDCKRCVGTGKVKDPDWGPLTCDRCEGLKKVPA